MHYSLTALIALSMASAAGAQSTDEQQILGWWRATLTHAGEKRDIWLHFQDRNGNLIASFSNPTIGVDDTPLSKVNVTPKTVELTSLGWTLQRDHQALKGVIADALIPLYKLDARFVRSGKPPLAAAPPRPMQRPPKPIWTQSLHSGVYAGLLFDPARHQVIAASDSGDVTALRATDGAFAWSVDAGAAIRATPVVAGSALYVPTDKALLKLDLATGRRLWASSLGKAKGKRLEINDPNSRYDEYASSAVISGDSVYAGSRDGCVYRFKADSGETVGRYCATDLITATPVVDGDRVYFASFDQYVYAAERDNGRIVWRRDVHGAVPRDLALAGNKILTGSRSYDLLALNKATGKPSWIRYYWFSWVDSVPNIVGSTIYIGSSDSLRVYALDSASGHKLWETAVPGWTWAKPAVGRRTVYASVTGTATPYMGPRLGGLAAIDRGTGKLRWLMGSEKPDKAPEYGFASAPVVAEGRMFAADLAGKVYAFKED
jgi:outer membrane protein assembly factor BamB